jgi:hypothetical protein
MSMMTVREILDCEITEGVYKMALEHLYQDIEHFTASSFYTKDENKPLVESLCATFTALYELSDPIKQNEKLDCDISKSWEVYIAGKNNGYHQAFQDVMDIADKVKLWYSEKIFIPPTGELGEPVERYSAAGARTACDAIKLEIKALEVKE